MDLRDGDAVRAAVRAVAPRGRLPPGGAELGRPVVGASPPARCSENIATAVNVLEAIRHEAPGARVVWVSSCEVYGPPAALPVPESAPIAPASPYAVSKAGGEMLAAVYAESFGLDLVRARPFSHSGPGPAADLPALLADPTGRRGPRSPAPAGCVVVTGNPDTRRDFTDVRDMVARLPPARGERRLRRLQRRSARSVSSAEQVQLLAELVAPIVVEHVVDPARVRAHEIMDLRGDHSRLTAATGWEPQIPLRQTMADTLGWWERELAAGR